MLQPDDFQSGNIFITAMDEPVFEEAADDEICDPGSDISETNFKMVNDVPIKAPRIENMSLAEQLNKFPSEIEIDIPAFKFLRAKTDQNKKFFEVSRKLLSILPSPACAEQSFSKASIMTGDRKNKLKIANLKERLVLFGFDL